MDAVPAILISDIVVNIADAWFDLPKLSVFFVCAFEGLISFVLIFFLVASPRPNVELDVRGVVLKLQSVVGRHCKCHVQMLRRQV